MKRFVTLVCGTALTLMLTGAAFAGTVSKTLTFSDPVQVNGTTLQPGDYKVTFDDNAPTTQLTFKKGKKEVATAQAQVKPADRMIHTTSVEFNTEGSTRKLQQIQFGGSNQALVLAEGGSNSTSGQ
jgi:hypothetical protein